MTEPPADVTTAIRRAVLDALGRPLHLYRVAVFPLWGDCYRVNVLAGPDAATATVTNSFFVVADARGAIVRSEPAIHRQY